MASSLDDVRREILAGAPQPEERPGGRPARLDGIATAAGYAWMRLRRPDLEARLRALVRHPRIEGLYDAKTPGTGRLLYGLIARGDPIDRCVSDFSAAHYLEIYPDVAISGIHPFVHYLLHGRDEGRVTLRRLREGLTEGAMRRDGRRPGCLIVLPALTASGAAGVALALARQAAATHDVTILAERSGPLLEAFREVACTLAVTEHLSEDLGALPPEVLGRLSFAILVSVGAFGALRPLVARDIPLAVYATEDSDDTRPRHRALFSALFADLLVFPSGHLRASWAGILADQGQDLDRDTLIAPPADLRAGGVGADDLRAARARLSHRLNTDIGGRRLIVGTGTAHWRSGTDLFVMAAQTACARDPDALFLWVGDGFDHEDPDFGLWIDRHLREVGGDRPGSTLHILPDGPARSDALQAADALFLPARLDPLATAAFDAVAEGCHVVAFEGATGLSDARHAGVDLLHLVPYGDLPAAVDRLLGLPRKSAGESGTVRPPPPDMFGSIDVALRARLAASRSAPAEIDGDGDFDVPLLFSTHPGHAADRARARRKVWSLGRRMVWPSADAARAEIAASDHWVHCHLSVEPFAFRPAGAPVPDFAIHLHAHHLEDLAEDLCAYRAYREARRIVVTTDTEAKAGIARTHLAAAKLSGDVLVMENRGRDILPFLRLFWPDAEGRKVADDGVWAHVHQKKAIGTSPSGDIWRRFLMTILLGDATRLSQAPDLMAEPDAGLVGAFDPYTSGWVGARRLLDRVAGLPGPLPERPLLFPIGNMFWTRGSVVTEMTRLFPPDFPWPNEPIGDDGTVYHLIERLWPTAAAAFGRRSVFLEKRDQPRA